MLELRPSRGQARPVIAQTARAPVRLRGGRRDDRPYVVELSRSCFADFGDYERIIDQWLDFPGLAVLVAERDGQRLGFAMLAPHRRLGFLRARSAELVAIAVAPAARREGVGRVLLERAELLARAWGACELRLHTAVSNAVARRFFEAAGYGVREAEPSYYPAGQQALEMVRVLR